MLHERKIGLGFGVVLHIVVWWLSVYDHIEVVGVKNLLENCGDSVSCKPVSYLASQYRKLARQQAHRLTVISQQSTTDKYARFLLFTYECMNGIKKFDHCTICYRIQPSDLIQSKWRFCVKHWEFFLLNYYLVFTISKKCIFNSPGNVHTISGIYTGYLGCDCR